MPQTLVLCSSRKLDLPEKAVDEAQVCEGFEKDGVCHNATGENKMEEWREKPAAGDAVKRDQDALKMGYTGKCGASERGR